MDRGLDKTGTLTTGKPSLTDIVTLDSTTKSELLRLAASAERFSEHPISHAIRRAANELNLTLFEPAAFRSIAGCGVEAQVDARLVRVGRLDWLERERIEVSQQARASLTELQNQGQTVLAVASGQSLVGFLAVRDVLRPEAREALQSLKGQGIRTVMLTGDNAQAAGLIASEAGIEETHSKLMPEDKLRLVRQWQAEGKRVAFVGDGINDAPALAAADIGIAMGAAGTDVALETSDIAFLNDDLTKMPEVIELSRRTLKVIRQNIAFSVGLNVLSLVAAGLGWVSPIGGAIIHESGAMAVILNAIRLLR